MNRIHFTHNNWLALSINNNSFLSIKKFIKGCVIDLGCGTAQYKNEILKSSTNYVGVDWGNSLHEKSKVDVFANLSKALPFKENYADTIVTFQVIEHIPEPSFFLSECFRILKPNGFLVLTVPFMWHVHEKPHDYFRFTRYGLTYLLEKNRFKCVLIHENTGFWQTWILKFNYHTIRFSKGIFKFFWIPIWWTGQVIAPILDRYDKHPEECASYTVVAKKEILNNDT